MADLPHEVLSYHIFLKLSFKSFLRCKCVCKAWYRVLCDPEFFRIHLLNQHQQKLLIATRSINCSYHHNFYSANHEASENTRGAEAVKLNLNFPKDVDSAEILGSSNGLLCVAVRYRKRRYSEDDDEDILMWNPSTGDSKLIPDTDTPLSYSDSPLVGFAYDFSTNDAKIVRVTNVILSHPFTPRVDVYSTKRDSWNIIKSDAPFSLVGVRDRGRGCAVNGSIYWLVYFEIVGFNITDNNFRKLQLPCDLGRCYHIYLEVFGGTLGVFRFSIANGLEVWTMKEDEKEEWIKFMHINVCGATRFIDPICLMRNGKVLVLFHEELRKSSSNQKRSLCCMIPEETRKEILVYEGLVTGILLMW